MIITMNLDSILAKLDEYTFASDYAEPGYSLNDSHIEGNPPLQGILFADYNRITKEEMSFLESRFACEWSDEWTTCDTCNKAFRTSPDSYSWSQYGRTTENGDTDCGDCILDTSSTAYDEYLEYLINNCHGADTIGIDPESIGFTKSIDSEAGLREYHATFPYYNNDPCEAVKRHINTDTHDYLFTIDSVEQFGLSYTLWSREKESTE